MQYHLDTQICTSSGLLHDISAVVKPNDMLLYAQNNAMWIDEAEYNHPFLLHQRISKIIAEDIFGITDARILSAIECHSTLKANANEYDMALFIADKLSWDQEGAPPFQEELSTALEHSLEKACYTYMRYIVDHNLILQPHTWFVEGLRYLESVL